MKQAVLLGNPGTKRAVYLERAAAQSGIFIRVIDWKDWIKRQTEDCQEELFLKIDPPQWESCQLEELSGLTGQYLERLGELAHMAQTCPVTFLNEPYTIAALLDKRACKHRLLQAGVPVTETLPEPCVKVSEKDREENRVQGSAKDREENRMQDRTDSQEGKSAAEMGRNAMESGGRWSAGDLLEMMRQKRICQVFLKPVRGSGAAGVSAFRFQPSTGRMALYTCALHSPEFGLINTKKLRRFSAADEVIALLNQILALDCVVEKWYVKAEYQGFSYDLRVVVQDKKVDFILARLSKGPITNLHLNNHPLEVNRMGLPGTVLDSVEELCLKSMECYPGLRSAGIDVLLERGSLRPRVIEMNAQGDLIYQDIYNRNQIYCHQAEMMRDWLHHA